MGRISIPSTHTNTHTQRKIMQCRTDQYTGVWKMCLENQENQSTGLPVTLSSCRLASLACELRPFLTALSRAEPWLKLVKAWSP